MTQYWLQPSVATFGFSDEMYVRVDCISALYAVRDPSARKGEGRPWRLEAAVLGLGRPVVLVTAPDRDGSEAGENPFRGALVFLCDELAAEQSRVWPGVEVLTSTGYMSAFNPQSVDGEIDIEWIRTPDPEKQGLYPVPPPKATP
ncbi:hypothetical protein ACOQFV_07555 [Nocardiopsis changdeensis]|uniref:Uncharacterized protein n=1 Tax=Nocardiopsis changdeensis TaxID=2831969 RepID=A0ABX8BIB8_9ACTN|nr:MULTISPECIES: hypothetical protein [Nocardiopsis]QUX20578.1 hypothetical protein KGD84_18915 [Nocardiopsis changdeensis]QYX36509.1 hypothetical protein K1J57_28370 [Nocardiopsis sp. MT53]